jgi:hypothetical protein
MPSFYSCFLSNSDLFLIRGERSLCSKIIEKKIIEKQKHTKVCLCYKLQKVLLNKGVAKGRGPSMHGAPFSTADHSSESKNTFNLLIHPA